MADVSQLTSGEFVGPMIEYLEEHFPRRCSTCGREFESFNNFVSETSPVGTGAYDRLEDLLNDVGHPLGALSFVNCRCGTTLCVECGDTESDMYRGLIQSLEHDIAATGLSASEVLSLLRDEIRRRISA